MSLRPIGIKPRMLHYIIVMFTALVFSLPALHGNAHEVRPTIADFEVLEDNTFQLSVSTNLEAIIAEIGADHDDTNTSPNAVRYGELRALDPIALEAELKKFLPGLIKQNFFSIDNAATALTVGSVKIPVVGDLEQPRISVFQLTGTMPSEAKTFVWEWPKQYGQSVIRTKYKITESDNPAGFSKFLSEGEKSDPIPVTGLELTLLQFIWQNLVYGFEHIIPLGLDHILFVVGLFLLSAKLVPLLWQITSFTLAHSVTLALGMLGIINIAPSIVEPLIAASIVYVCIENIFTSNLQKWRPVVVFVFGLLHGLGFAGVLSELGLEGGNFFVGLLSFNIGVEIGQLAVIAICFALVGYWFRDKEWYRERITIPASMVIACIGAYWFYERVFL